MLRLTPNPTKPQLNRIVDELMHSYPSMTRKELTKGVREFFRKRREYMNGRIDTACHGHFEDTRIDSLEAESTVLEFVESSVELIDSIRSKAQIDVEESGAARAFVKERVYMLL